MSNKPSILVFAHAGMSLFQERTLFAPNSFEAIKYSIDVLDAEGIEVDVQITKDSVLVLFHDEFITTSPHYSGCIGNYDWEVLKDLTLSNNNEKICRLDSAMNFILGKNIPIYLDFKLFNFCNEPTSFDVFSRSLDSIMKNYTIAQRHLIIAGSLNKDFLNTLNVDNKSIETKNVDNAIAIAEQNEFQYILVPENLINEEEALKLKNTPFRWGVFGGKSNGEIRKSVRFKPTYFVSDNLVYTQKITE